MNTTVETQLKELYPQALDYVQNMAKSGIMHHAYLISSIADGPQNAFAQYWAKLILGQEAESDVDRGVHTDFHLIQPNEKGTIAIEQARELQHAMAATPQRGTYRVAIVQHADTMSVSAANALLKSIEEPHEHSVILLTASQPQRLLATIRSRVHEIALPQLRNEQMQRVAQDIMQRQWVSGKFERLVDLASENTSAFDQWKDERESWTAFLGENVARRSERMQKWLKKKPEKQEVLAMIEHVESLLHVELQQTLTDKKKAYPLQRKLQFLQKAREMIHANTNKNLLIEYLTSIL